MRKKKRVNWTIDQHSIEILTQAQKLNGTQNTTFSELVEFAISNTFKNKKEYFREQMRQHQQKIMEFRDKIKELDVKKSKKLKEFL